MKILIVGLGVIGGGYAMALKEAGYSEVYGIDTNEETLKKAKEMKIIKEGFTREDEIISEMDLIVLAIYPNLVKDFIVKNKNKFKENINDLNTKFYLTALKSLTLAQRTSAGCMIMFYNDLLYI